MTVIASGERERQRKRICARRRAPSIFIAK
jgi:hypothetical protein